MVRQNKSKQLVNTSNQTINGAHDISAANVIKICCLKQFSNPKHAGNDYTLSWVTIMNWSLIS